MRSLKAKLQLPCIGVEQQKNISARSSKYEMNNYEIAFVLPF